MVRSFAASRRAWPSGPRSCTLVVGALLAMPGCAIVHEQRLSVVAPPSAQNTRITIEVDVYGGRESFYSIPPQPPADRRNSGTVTLRSEDARREYTALSVQTIEVRYRDLTLPPEVRSFERCQTEFINGKAELPIINAISRCGDAQVIVRGTLHAANGEARPFECRRDIAVVVESDWHFSTFLDWIASC